MASDFRPKHCEPYRGGWRYRRRVPEDCRAKIGRGSWCHNFKADAPLAQIEATAKRLARQHDRAIAVARGEAVGPAQVEKAETAAKRILRDEPENKHWLLDFLQDGAQDPETMALINALEHGGLYVPASLSVTAALERDRRLYGGDHDPKSLNYAADSFVGVVGDKDVTAIRRADVAEWLAAQTKQGLAPATIRRRFGALRAMVNRCYLDFDHNRRNPFEKHKINGGSGAASDRLPFNEAMLSKIDAYLDSGRPGHETVNILRIMRGTGGGPAEVGGLVLADVSLDNEVPYIWVRRNTLRRIKEDVRDRQVPLIGDALVAAQDAVERARRRTKGQRMGRDKTPVFASFGINDRGADSISAKLNKAIRKAGVPRSPRLTCYSLRHTIKEALRSAGVVDHVQRRVLGHAGHGVADRYGSPRARLVEARDAITAALDHLGDVDEAIYSEAERLKG